MFHRITVSLAASLSLLAVAGCASKDNKYGPVDGANAPAAGADLGDSSEQSAGGFGGSGGPGFASHFAPGAPGCDSGSVSAVPANPVDSDGDNTPDTLVVTFTNCAFVSSNGTETFNGTVTIADGTPSVADFDFNAAHDVTIDFLGAGANAGDSGTVHVTGARSASGSAAGPTYSLADATANEGDVTHNGASHHVADNKSWTVTYTPSGAWTPGTAMVNGALSISGAWSIHVDDQAAESALSSNGLQVSASCPTHIVAGSVSAAYAGNGGAAAITVTWTGCGQRTVSFTGNS